MGLFSNLLKRKNQIEEITKEFRLNNKVLKFTNKVDESDNSKIFTSRYFFMDVRGKRRPVITKQIKDEYYGYLKAQLNYLEGKRLTEQDIFEALIAGCKEHIKKYGRLIISDLYGQLHATMHIVDATKGIFHNHIKTEDDGIELRNFYQNGAQELLEDFILVPDPSNPFSDGKYNLVTLKSVKGEK